MLRVSTTALAVLLALVAALAPAAVRAGAWTLAPKEGLAILTLRHLEAGERFDADGDLAPGGYAKTELAAYGEWGIAEGWTGVLGSTLQRKRVDGPPADARTGLDYSFAGLRVRLAEGAWGVLSAQGTLRAPGATDASAPAQIGSTQWEADGRLLFGRGGRIGGWHAFADLQLGWRHRAGAPPGEWRADATFGLRPVPRALLTAQLFRSDSDGSARPPFPESRSLDAALAAAWDVAPAWTLQAGALGTLTGRATGREIGGFVALWRRF